MKNLRIKRTVMAKALLLIFVGQLLISCSQVKESTPEEELLNAISLRLKQNDYVGAVELDSTNPHGTFGKKIGRIYQRMLQYPSAATHQIQYGSAIVLEDAEAIRRLKAVTKFEVEKEGIVFSEDFIDRFSDQVKDYRLNTEGVASYMADAVKSQALTTTEHDIIRMELEEMAVVTTMSKAHDIIRTIEFEVTNSNIPSRSKDKILMFNALASNSLISSGSLVNQSAPNLFSSPFRKTAPLPYTVATVLVVWAAVTLISAFTNPSCDATCQLAMATQAASYVAAGQLICEAIGAESTCPCTPPCHLSAVGYCQCP